MAYTQFVDDRCVAHTKKSHEPIKRFKLKMFCDGVLDLRQLVRKIQEK
jgi:hypothetical protein